VVLSSTAIKDTGATSCAIESCSHIGGSFFRKKHAFSILMKKFKYAKI
jgi:hypothetical protein